MRPVYNHRMPRTTVPVKTGLTFEEYLEFERTSPVKHEFTHGQLFMMAGTSDRYNRIAGRFYARLLAAETGTCRTFFADMKVRTLNGRGYYPDIIVTCDEDDDDAYVKRKPCLVVEVLSDGAEAIDRGDKFHDYRKFDTLQAYVLVNQHVPRLEIYRHAPDGWRYDAKETGETLELPCLDVVLEVDALYAGA